MAENPNSDGFLHWTTAAELTDPATDIKRAANVAARFREAKTTADQAKTDATQAKLNASGAAAAAQRVEADLSRAATDASTAKTQSSQAVTTANAARTTAIAAEAVVRDELQPQVDALKTAAGYAPGDATDAAMANVGSNPDTQFRAVLNAQFEHKATRPVLELEPLPGVLSGLNEQNAVSFIRSNVVTTDVAHYVAWWDDQGHPVVGRLPINGGAWNTYDLHNVAGNPLASPVAADNHNTISMVIDPAGFIHVWANHHENTLRYVRSTSTHNINGWEAVPSMVGNREARFTYPYPIISNGVLYLIYRDGAATSGDLVMNRYNHDTKQWSRIGVILSGASLSPVQAPYIAQPGVGPDGTIHLFVTYRDSATVGPGGNHDIGHIKSADGGVTWRSANGANLSLPVTPSILPIVELLDGNARRILNQVGASVDIEGRPHAAAWLRNTSTFRLDLYHWWWDGSAWKSEKAVDGLDYGTTDTTMLARPAVFSTPDGRTFVLYRTQRLDPRPLWCVEVTPGAAGRPFPLANLDLGGSEPTYEPGVEVSGRLNMLITPTMRYLSEMDGTTDSLANTWGALLSIDTAAIDRVSTGEVATPAVVPGASGSPVVVRDTGVILARVGAAATSGAGIVHLRQESPNAGRRMILTSAPLAATTAGRAETTVTTDTALDAFSTTGTLQVGTTAGMAPSGVVQVVTATGWQNPVGVNLVRYTGKTATTLTGCTTETNLIVRSGNKVIQAPSVLTPWQPVRRDLLSGDLARLSAELDGVSGAAWVETAVVSVGGKTPTWAGADAPSLSAFGDLRAHWRPSLLPDGAVSSIPDSRGSAPALVRHGSTASPAVAGGWLQMTGTQALVSAAEMTWPGDFTLVVAAKRAAQTAANETILAMDDGVPTLGAPGRVFQLRYRSGADSAGVVVFNGATANEPTGTAASGVRHAITVQRVGRHVHLYVGGKYAGRIITPASPAPNIGPELLAVGARLNTAGALQDFLTGEIGDMALYAGALPDHRRRAAEAIILAP